jgi:predicted ATPase
MKILELKVEGFRSLKSATWKPGDLNVVIGPNAGGKSNLLQLLEMIAASARGELAKFVNKQGGMQPLVWDGQAENISFVVNLSTPISSNDKSKYEYKLDMWHLGSGSGYSIVNEYLNKDGDNQPLVERSKQKVHVKGVKDDLHLRLLTPESIDDEESLLSFIKGLIVPNEEANTIRNNMLSWSIYSEFNTCRDAPVRQPSVTSYAKGVGVDSDGRNFAAVLHTLYEKDRNFKKEINLAMQAAFGEEFEEICFPPAFDGRSQFAIRWRSLETEQSAAKLSDGTLRFLYLLTILAHPEPPALIAIDEPETGLHPSMMSIIAEYAIEAARKTQVIITTHSPEFLGAFRDTQPTTTICEWRDGQTKLRVISGEQLDYWLNNYTLGELYRSGQLENMK